MNIEELDGEEDGFAYGTYRVTSVWYPESPRTIHLRTGYSNLHKDQFLWAVFDKLDELETKLRLLNTEHEELQQHHFKRAFLVTDQYERIKQLEKQINENSGNP